MALNDQSLSPLQVQLHAAAADMAKDAGQLSALLAAMGQDVARVQAEPLEIFPVAHHSPACAVQLVRRLERSAPKIIFVEACEDMQALIADLPSCTAPVALQAFAQHSDTFPPQLQPLSLVMPMTPFSAEYQAICFALANPEVELIFVDRSSDHVFQWMPLEKPKTEDSAEEDENARLHGGAIGVELGSLIPTFPELLERLLEHSRTSGFTEWWTLYVDEPTLGADYDTWRQVMVLVGSLIRRLGSSPEALERDRLRERYMWTRMKEHLQARGLAPSDALYICGAAHAASDVPEWGTARWGQPDDPRWQIPPRTDTPWQYGFIPSSYSAIERQFGLARGTVSLADQSWEKAIKALELKPTPMPKPSKGEGAAPKSKTKAKKAAPAAEPTEGGAAGLLTRPPALRAEDHEQLLAWCTGLVSKARENHYMASTADAIAIYQTSLLLARLRGRIHPSAFDFADAAETCLDKGDRTMRRSVRHLCGMIMGGDRIGKVGYHTLPPLVRDLYDRLAPAGVTPGKSTITRALMDLRKDGPKWLPISDLLWRLRYLVPSSDVARPVMGELRLGGTRVQESWDIKLHGPALRDVIELAYEGVTVEQVVERRLREAAWAPSAQAAKLLELAEDALLYADSPALSQDLGARAVELLRLETTAANAGALFERVRRLVHHLRSRPEGLPAWLGEFVATGYQHYASLLPQSFADRGTSPEQLAGLLSFVFSLESLALALGCQRSQLIIAVQQAAALTQDLPKLGLLWAAEWTVELRTGEDVRAAFDALLDNPSSLSALPEALGGLLLALSFTPLVAGLAAEQLTRAFMELPEGLLLPWLPGLLDSLRPVAATVLPALMREVTQGLPRSLAELDRWQAPWEEGEAPPAPAQAAGPARSAEEQSLAGLLRAQPAALEGWGAVLGVEVGWVDEAAVVSAAPEAPVSAADPVQELVQRFPDSVGGWARVLGS